MEDMQKMFQVSTLQALALGYSRGITDVETLLTHGDTGLGTFEDVDGEMIVTDGICYRATDDGTVTIADKKLGVPFASVTKLRGNRRFELETAPDIDSLKRELMLRIEEDFGLNSMHMARIDGYFTKVSARSETGTRAHHISLKDALSKTQKDFYFEDVRGTLICVYYPDYMDGINAAGWHLHFISEDKTMGGHVFDIDMKSGQITLDKISRIEIAFPTDPAFDTYSLKQASHNEIKEVEQGKK